MNSKLLYNLNSSSYCASWEFMRQCENGNIWWVSEWVTKSIERSNYENICNAFKLSSNTFSVYRKHSHICTIFIPLHNANVHFLILSTIINLKKYFPYTPPCVFHSCISIQLKRTVYKNSENKISWFKSEWIKKMLAKSIYIIYQQ